MNELEQILRALDERELNLAVGRKHDEVRMRYPLQRVTVEDFREFEQIIGDYYAHHFGACVAPGARLPPHEAQARAKQLIEDEYRRTRGQTLNNACDDAMEGREGGMRKLLDILCDGLKRESEANYAAGVFDRFVVPNRFADKVELIRQLIGRFSGILPASVVHGQPEEFAHDYKDFVRVILDSMRSTARVARR